MVIPPTNLDFVLNLAAKIGINGPNRKFANIMGTGNQKETSNSGAGNFFIKKGNEFKTIKFN